MVAGCELDDQAEGVPLFSITLCRNRLIDPVRCAVDALGMAFCGSFLRRWAHKEAALLPGHTWPFIPDDFLSL